MNHATILFCSTGCKLTTRGQDYMGVTSVTQGGITCQRWDTNSPHTNNHPEIEKYPDDSLADAANYCRNPDLSDLGPWCYTTDAGVSWDYCAIPFCGRSF